MTIIERRSDTEPDETASSNNRDLLFRRAPENSGHPGLSAEEMAKYIRQRVEFDRMVAQETPKFSALRRA